MPQKTQIDNLTSAVAERDLVGELLCRVSPDLGECRVVMRHRGKFMNSHPFSHGSHDLVYELAPKGSDASPAENLTRIGSREKFHEPVHRGHDDGFAMVVERVRGLQI